MIARRTDEMITRLLGVLNDYTDALPLTIDATRDEGGHPAVIVSQTITVDGEPIPYSLVPSATLRAWSQRWGVPLVDWHEALRRAADEAAPPARRFAEHDDGSA